LLNSTKFWFFIVKNTFVGVGYAPQSTEKTHFIGLKPNLATKLSNNPYFCATMCKFFFKKITILLNYAMFPDS